MIKNETIIATAGAIITLLLLVIFGILAFDIDDIYQALDAHNERLNYAERYCGA